MPVGRTRLPLTALGAFLWLGGRFSCSADNTNSTGGHLLHLALEELFQGASHDGNVLEKWKYILGYAIN